MDYADQQNTSSPPGNHDRRGGKRDLFNHVVIVAVVTAVLMFGLYALSYRIVGAKAALTDQSIANYIGIVFGTAVALAGSFVAIELAKRALESADVQLQLSRLSNEIADRQSTEAALAVDGTARYQQLKGMLLTVPAMLRRAQRDRLFDDPAKSPLVAEMVRIVGTAIDALMASNVPSTVVELASQIEGQQVPGQPRPERTTVQSQRYFEYAMSSLQYDLSVARVTLEVESEGGAQDAMRLQIMRLLQATYALVRELDDLFVFAAALKIERPGMFTELQKKFIGYVGPVATLNRGLDLPDDFGNFADEISFGHLPRLGSVGPLVHEAVRGEAPGGLLLSLHDSGYVEALAGIQRLLADKSDAGKPGERSKVIRLDGGAWIAQARQLEADVLPVFFITEKYADRLLQLHHFLAEAGGKWRRRIVVLDQVERAPAQSVSSSRLSLEESIVCWRLFSAAAEIVRNAERSMLIHRELDLRDLVLRSRPVVMRHLDDNDWRTILRDKRLAVLEAIASAAASLALRPDDLTLHAADVLSWTEKMVCAVQDDASDEDLLDAAFPSFDLDDGPHMAMSATIRLLGELPLLERPLFGFANVEGGLHTPGDTIDFSLPRTTVFGIAYLDSSFGLPLTPWLALLAERRTCRLF
ncbi:hypothetical protein [Massilia sp.]|uniref:hypothetical protein n=1 Tax=Massilia sp. TaxID=1882437 RepID=UPI0028A12D6F|nr:hypothetical protein [Massilia sp.]